MQRPVTNEAQERLLATWYGRLSPDRPLDIAENDEDRSWYVALDEVDGDGEHGLRGPAAVENIMRGIRASARLPSSSSTHLFAGFRGTGKTTELGRLTSELRKFGAPGFSVLRVNARRYHPLGHALSVEELAVLLAAGIGEAALETLGDQSLPRLSKSKDGAWARVHELLRKNLGAGAVTFKLGVVDIKPALFDGKSLRDQLRASLGQHPHEKLREFLQEFVLEIAVAIQPRQLVIVVDDLDKFTVPTMHVAEVYQQMADLFFHHVELLKLPACHAIYTVPPYLAFLNQEIAGAFGGYLHILPAVKVQGRPPERVVHTKGIEALTGLIQQRVDLDVLFGTAKSECMERLVIASGGNLRDLEALMRAVVESALDLALPVSMREVEGAINRQGAIRTLLKDDLDILLEVSKHGSLDLVPRNRLGAFAGAMDQHLMLCCWNGDFWYDSHPLLARKLQRARETSSSGAESR
jgi:hypothetical protein